MDDNIQAVDTTQFAGQQTIPNTASYIGPCLVSYQGIIFAAWRGSDDDAGIYWSTFNEDGWASQQRINGVSTGYLPAFGVFRNTLYLAWRGSGDDNGIWYCNYDGAGWTEQQLIPGVSSAYGPSLAEYNGLLFASWRGSDDDEGIYWATYDGSNWSAQQRISGVASFYGPSLTVHNDLLYAAWRGTGADNSIYYATCDDSGAWSAQNSIPNVATARSPSITSFNHRLYVSWRGSWDDNGLYWCTTDGLEFWGAQQNIMGVGSSNRPAMVAHGGLLFMAWKGANDDEALYWTTGWCGSVKALWRIGSVTDTSGLNTSFTRTDLFTMSLATTGFNTGTNFTLGTGPYQTWSFDDELFDLQQSYWNSFLNDWQELGDNSFQAIGTNPCFPVTVMSPVASSCLSFYVNMTGRVISVSEQISAGNPDATGSQFKQIISVNYPRVFQPGASVSSAARTSKDLYLFCVGYNGKAYTTKADFNNGEQIPGWNNSWQEIAPFGPEAIFLPSTPLTAITRHEASIFDEFAIHSTYQNNHRPSGLSNASQRNTDALDLFGVDSQGNVLTASWNEQQWPLGTSWTNLGGDFPSGAPVTAVARTSYNMDIFIIGKDGVTYKKSWTLSHGWSSSWDSVGGYFPVGNRVEAVSGSENDIDLFCVGFDGRVYTSSWNNVSGWNGIHQNWQEIGGFFPRNASPVALCRTAIHRDVFIVGNDGIVYSSYRVDSKQWSGFDNWTPVVVDSDTQTLQFLTPKGSSLSTTVTVTINASGTTKYHCLTDNTGNFGYDFSSKAFYQALSGEVLLFIHSGHVDDSSEDDYIEYNFHPYIHQMWSQIKGGRLFISEDYELTGVAGVIDKIFAFVLDLGAYTVGATLGVVLAISSEVANIFGNFSLGELIGLVAGTAILVFGGTAVLAVVAGYAAGKITQALISQVELDVNELAFAEQVFGNFSLPARVKLYKTNLSSLTGRAFTFPAGERTYINLGTDAFNDPTTYVHGSYPTPGELFIHEMTHAWQIQQSTFLAGQICSGIVAQAEYLSGSGVYSYPPPGQPWHEFGVEQQGAVVDQWFGGIPVYGAPLRNKPMDILDPYYRYIRDNILLSVTE